MKYKIRELRNKLERIKGNKEIIKKNIGEDILKLEKEKEALEDSEKAKVIIYEVAQKTQKNLEYHFSDIVNLGMASIFTHPYQLIMDFKIRAKIEVDLKFKRERKEIDPMYGSGVGSIEAAAMALRFSSWALKRNKTRPIICLDEPLKALKGKDYPEKGAEMIKQISHKLGLQIIMNSHDKELIQSADNVIDIGIKKGVSYIK